MLFHCDLDHLLTKLLRFPTISSLVWATCLSSAAIADIPIGFIGGEEDVPDGPALAYLISSGGSLTSLSGLPSGVAVNEVGINSSGNGIIGLNNRVTGEFGMLSPTYAYFFSSNGTLTSISGIPSQGGIVGVGINDSGTGIIGGFSSTAPFVYLVSPSGALTSVAGLASDLDIASVAINDSSTGIIGANLEVYGGNQPFAYLVAPNGATTSLVGLTSNGFISSVAINNSGAGIIGGDQASHLVGAPSTPIAYLVAPSGALTALQGLPSKGEVFNVAINDSGAGIIGGGSFGGGGGDFGLISPAFACLVSPSGAITTISGLPSNGGIASVAINATGAAIIGGENNTTPTSAPIAYLVSPTGSLTTLAGLPSSGSVSGVAINDSGAGLIGGNGASVPFAYLVTPSGGLVALSGLPSNAEILSVAMIDLSQIPTSQLTGNNLKLANYINTYASDLAFYFLPANLNGTLSDALSSAAPTRNAFSIYQTNNTLFLLNSSLSLHARDARLVRAQNAVKSSQLALNERDADGLLAFSGPGFPLYTRPASKEPPAPMPPPKERPFELWGTLLGSVAYQKAEHQAPAFQPNTGAAILAFDGKVGSQGALGIGGAYAFTHIHEKQNAGYANINQELLFLYALWDNTRFYFDAALWGGLFQSENVRKVSMTGFYFRPKAHIKGWQIAPHFEFGYDYRQSRCFTVEPFVVFDWISNWQDAYTESGGAPFDMGQKAQYSSFLRSEGGLRLYESINFHTWRLIFQETAAYVNRKPFKVGIVQSYIVGFPGSFTVETLSTTQNVGLGEFQLFFVPKNPRYPYATLDYQGEFALQYQSHTVSLNVNWNF